jgi:CRP/FNR family transcriptional regulator, cyclic AMP receptor protein
MACSMGGHGTDSGPSLRRPAGVTAGVADDQVQAVIAVCGPFDRTAAARVVDTMLRVLARDVGEIHLDLREVTEMTPSAVPTLVHVRRRAARLQVGLRLVVAPGRVCEILRDSGLAGGFELLTTLPPHLDDLAQAPHLGESTAAFPWPRPRITGDHDHPSAHEPRIQRPPWVHVLHEDEDLAAGVAPGLLTEATDRLRARELTFGKGSLPALPPRSRLHVGLLVLDGLLVRRVGTPSGFSAELLGPGDVLRVAPHPGEDLSPQFTTQVRGLVRGRMAILDGAFADQAGRYPPVLCTLLERSMTRAQVALVSLAIAHHPRVERRLHVVLWQLAQRFGNVTPDGIVLRVPLTHALLADLTASRRPSVTLALQQLEARGVVVRRDGDLVLLDEPEDATNPELATAAPEHR